MYDLEQREAVARWMIALVRERGRVSQHAMTTALNLEFGDLWVEPNGRINRRLAATFRRLHAGNLRWDVNSWTSVS